MILPPYCICGSAGDMEYGVGLNTMKASASAYFDEDGLNVGVDGTVCSVDGNIRIPISDEEFLVIEGEIGAGAAAQLKANNGAGLKFGIGVVVGLTFYIEERN